MYTYIHTRAHLHSAAHVWNSWHVAYAISNANLPPRRLPARVHAVIIYNQCWLLTTLFLCSCSPFFAATAQHLLANFFRALSIFITSYASQLAFRYIFDFYYR